MSVRSKHMIRDGKDLPLSGNSVYFQFIISVVVLFPVLLALIPLAIFFQAVNYLTGKISRAKKPASNTDEPSGSEECKSASKSTKRDFDLVLYGATGFTGRLAAMYIAKQYGSTKFRWAIAGRRRDALENIRKELTAIDSSLSTLAIVIADASNPVSLHDMVCSTKVVITTTGPFDRYGSGLVKSCAENGTHYADITGETDWVRKMIDLYDETARASGARIVHFCGHDCVPWDLTVMECAKALKKSGESLVQVKCFDAINSAPSGGTLETIFHSLENRTQVKTTLGFDPMIKTLKGDRSTSKTLSKNPMLMGYSKEMRAWTGPFLMALVNGNCVRRSNALLNYGPSVTYSESQLYPSFMAGFVTLIQLSLLAVALALPPLAWVLRKFFLPAPGQGPSTESMDEGFLNVSAFARGEKGGEAQAEMYFPTDPGYRDTGRMLVESGLSLALGEDRLTCPGGIYTPGPCIGEVLLQRLIDTGTHFSVKMVDRGTAGEASAGPSQAKKKAQ